MSEYRFAKEGLSFDDVLLVPARSEVLPRDVDTSTRLTDAVKLDIPILSAAMDTVTEARLAIALAREGGIGIIHRNMSVEHQAAEVDRVKRSESGMIEDPVTLSPDRTVRQAIEIMRHYHISGVPITEGTRLLGILTNRDLRFVKDLDRKVSELMTSKNLVTTPVGTSLEQAKDILHAHRIEKLLVVDDNFNLRGLITIKDIEKLARHPNAAKDEKGRLRAGAAVGFGADTNARVGALVSAGVDLIVLDSSHGHGENVLRTLEELKSDYPDLPMITGNVATYEGARDLILAGADAVKVGVGPGSICTTRVVTGVGVPQITAISECHRACSEAYVPLIADGGIRYSGDIVKALASGADAVMIGSLFAGTEESPGETVLYMGRQYKQYRAMGSVGAMREGARDRYFQEHIVTDTKLVPEGVEGRVPYKGPLSELIHQLVGGVRAGMGLCGAANLEELRTKAQFVRQTSSGLRESHPHDVIITEEAPNYQVWEG